MKKLRTLIVFIAMLCCSIASARDFEVDGIYYNILSLTTVEVTSSESAYSGVVAIPESVTYMGSTYSVTSIGNQAFYYCSSLKEITIPEGVASIGDDAFYHCRGLTSITIPESVTSIGGYAFLGCSGLTSITIPEGVTSIGGYAFYDCDGLKEITIPEGVTSIGDKAFYDCDGLKEITIPEGVTSIGSSAFSDTPWYNNQRDGLVYIGRVLYGYKGTMQVAITIKEGTTSIADRAFYNYSRLKKITIPNSVTSIGDEAFYGCTSLKEITIPEGVTSIGSSAFSDTPWYNNQKDGLVYIGRVLYDYKGTMPSGTSITIKEGTTSIGSYAFYNCDGLKEITIPNSVTSIGSYAFWGCGGLKEITISEGVTSIGDKAFQYCDGLKEITIPGSLTSFGGITDDAKTVHIILTDLAAWIKIHPSFSSNTENIHLYLNGEEITELAIPNDVTTVKDKAFLNLTGLTSITIPEGMTEIGDEAFMGCSNIKKIVCNATTPPTAYYDTFTGINKEKCVLMVPEGTEALYKEAKRWKDFLVIESIPSAIEQVAGPTADKGDIYDLSGRLVKAQAEGMDGLAPGVYVKNGKKYIVK